MPNHAKHAEEESKVFDVRDPASGTFRHRGEGRKQSDLACTLHDARNLLAVIGVNIDWLRDEVRPALFEVVDDLAVATARLQELLESTLASADRADDGVGLAYQLTRVSTIVQGSLIGLRQPP